MQTSILDVLTNNTIARTTVRKTEPATKVPVETKREPLTDGNNNLYLLCHIEQHQHTKRKFTMFMVVLDCRIDQHDFNQLRAQCYLTEGWYSRKWGKIPGGFAFKTRLDASNFMSFVTDYKNTN